MLGRLLVRLTIPITQRLDNTGAPLMFYRWLPIGQENGIHHTHGDYHLLLWLDVSCAVWGSDITPDKIAQMGKVSAYRTYADVTTDALNDQLLHHMTVRGYTRQPTPEEEFLVQSYEEHGREVLSLVRDGLNKLLTYARVEKGQYWLTPYAIDLDDMASHSVQFRARACVDDGPWFRWQPSQISRRTMVLALDQDPRYFTPEDWPHAQKFLVSRERPNLIRQLLAGSEFLADSGSDRAALTEAASALEAAVHHFARSPRAGALLPSSLRERLGDGSLSTLADRDHLGFSRFVSYLLPILLPEEELPSALLRRCRDAIEQRNQIVHGEQRQVDPDRLKQFLTAVRTLCETLMRWTVT
jgi:hypothetical protein